MAAAEPSVKTYNANCHCGNVRFTITHPSLEDGSPVVECNCSICTRNGYLLIYPLRTDVHFTRGWDTLREYRFGSKTGAHYFCPTCGTSLGAIRDSSKYWTLNARTIADLDVTKLVLEKFDGRSELDPPYTIPE